MIGQPEILIFCNGTKPMLYCNNDPSKVWRKT